MALLNQIIAVEKTVKASSYADFTKLHQQVQKSALLSGISRTYQPKDDEGDQLPAESTRVQLLAEDALIESANILTRMFNIVADKDWANCTARADIIVGTHTILSDVPVTYLLFLEKQLKDIHIFVEKLPVLDPSEVWHFDAATNSWGNESVQTIKTKKVPKNHVKFGGDEHHPPQVDIFTEDVVQGRWTQVKYSGALPAARVNLIIRRVEALQAAVTFAREQANMTPVESHSIGSAIFGYLFGT